MASVNRASSLFAEFPFQIAFHQVKGYNAASAMGAIRWDGRLVELKLRGADGVAAAMHSALPEFGCVNPDASPDKIIGYHTRLEHLPPAEIDLVKVELTIPSSVDLLNGDKKPVWLRLIGKVGTIAKDSFPYLGENAFTFNMTKGVEAYTVKNAFSGNPEISKKEEHQSPASPFPFTALKREK